MGYPAILHPLVRTHDVPTLGREFELAEADRVELVRQAIRLIVDIEEEPRIGREMRRRPGYEILADCHSLTFDLPGWRPKNRFRIVYKIDPSVEAIDRVLVFSIGPRPDLEAYKRARARRQAGDWP